MSIASNNCGLHEALRLSAVEIAREGGNDALHDFLITQLCTLIAVASTSVGDAYAYELLNAGLQSIEARQEIGA
jgi:hypothetical protein